MRDFDFSQPQRQSKVGLILIFGSALFQVVRNLWVVVIYFLVKEVDWQVLLLIFLGIFVILLLTLAYSVLAFLNFKFHIDEKNQEFVLRKGVISTDVINVPFEKIQQVNFRRNIIQRVIGVYSVVIETAGSQEKEIEIKALFKYKANELADRLLELKQTEKEEEPETLNPNGLPAREAVKKPEWEYHVGLGTLVKLGLTSNYLRGVGLIIAFYFTLREQFMLDEILPAELPRQQMMEKGSFIFIVGLLLFGILITVAETLIKFYGLNLKQYRHSLQVEMGLRNNTKVNIRAARVQMVEINFNPVQKFLSLFTLNISLASSENDFEKSRIKMPGLSPGVVKRVLLFFCKKEVEEEKKIIPHKIVFWRKFSRSLFPVVLLISLGFFYQEFIAISVLGPIAGVYVLLSFIYNYLYYAGLNLVLDQDILIMTSGLWVRKKRFLEIYRLQAVSIRQPYWYKRKGIFDLTFHSAGGDINFYGVVKEEVNPLVNYLLYKIESTQKHWM